MTDVTRIVSAIEEGDPSAAEQLLPLAYDELLKLAARKMAQENPGHTLQATALVHEAYLRLVDVEQIQHWDSRRHFFAAAAEAMRRILIEAARRKRADKHGGNRQKLQVAEGDALCVSDPEHWLALNDALTQLSSREPHAAELVRPDRRVAGQFGFRILLPLPAAFRMLEVCLNAQAKRRTPGT